MLYKFVAHIFGFQTSIFYGLCDSTPSGGGCVVGRCWESYPSLVLVSQVVSPHGSLVRLKAYALVPYKEY